MWPKETDAWVAYLDVFAFSSTVAERESSKTLKKLQNCWKRIWSEVLDEEDKPLVYRFSDSVFIIYPVTPRDDEDPTDDLKYDRLKVCMEDVSCIMDIFIDQALMLRGGIAYGPVRCTDDIVLGEPVVRAVNYEKWAPIPMVLLPKREVTEKPEERIAKNGIVFERLVLKKGWSMLGTYVFPYRSQECLDHVERMFEKHAHEGPFDHATVWHKTLKQVRSLVKREHGRPRCRS